MEEFINKKNILITNSRLYTSLDLARSFYNSGHNVYTADTNRLNFCSFSKCVKRNFVIPSPRFDFAAFEKKIAAIVKEYKIDLIVPIHEETLYLAKLNQSILNKCELFTSSLSILHKLHNKWLFSNLLDSFGIPSIPIKLIKRFEDLKNVDFFPYALKPCYSRSSLDLKKISSIEASPNILINENKPWIAQKWMEGKKYCSYSICRNGKVLAHSVYPNNAACGYCINFISKNHSKILTWTKNLVSKLNYTGQIAFDFIETKEGVLYALECNPRATSGMHLLSINPNLSNFFFEDFDEIYQPPENIGKQFVSAMFLYAFSQREEKQGFLSFIKKHLKYKDVLFCKKDIKPFLFQLFVLFSCIHKKFKYKLPLPSAFLYDLYWNNNIED